MGGVGGHWRGRGSHPSPGTRDCLLLLLQKPWQKVERIAAAEESDLRKHGIPRIEKALGRNFLEGGRRQLRRRLLAEGPELAASIFLHLLDGQDEALKDANNSQTNQDLRAD